MLGPSNGWKLCLSHGVALGWRVTQQSLTLCISQLLMLTALLAVPCCSQSKAWLCPGLLVSSPAVSGVRSWFEGKPL